MHVYARNIENDLLAEGARGARGGRNVRASRHRRTLRLHPIPRFYSLIPLCSPPGSQGDFYSSLRISTLTSRHPQPLPSLHCTPSPTTLYAIPPLSLSTLVVSSTSLSFRTRSSYPLLSLQVVAVTPSPPCLLRKPVNRSTPFVTLTATASRAHSFVRISSVVDMSQHCLKNRACTSYDGRYAQVYS